MVCKCVTCGTCNGNGFIVVGWEDHDREPETCPDCGGDGLTEFCLECKEKQMDEEYSENRD
jgi:DnaJ-class molecular chaperone